MYSKPLSSMSRKQLLDLPLEVLLNVGSHLNIVEKTLLGLTCKSIHKIFLPSPWSSLRPFERAVLCYRLLIDMPGYIECIHCLKIHRLYVFYKTDKWYGIEEPPCGVDRLSGYKEIRYKCPREITVIYDREKVGV